MTSQPGDWFVLDFQVSSIRTMCSAQRRYKHHLTERRMVFSYTYMASCNFFFFFWGGGGQSYIQCKTNSVNHILEIN